MRTLCLTMLVAIVGCNDTTSPVAVVDVAAPAQVPPLGRHVVAKDGPEYLTPWGWSTVPFVPPARANQAPSPSFAPYAIPSKRGNAVALIPMAMLLASEVPAVTPPSWLEPEWDFDPVAGNDSNNCLSVSTPCKTFAQIASRWGTLEPTFPQNTFVRQMNAQTGTGDPVRIRVHSSGTAAFWYIGVPHVLSTTTLGTVTAKTYGTAGSGHPLEALFAAGQSASYLVTDVTAASSTAFLDRITSGTTWILAQPLTAPVVPNTSFLGGRIENNAWTTGDSITIAQLPTIYMLEWSPTYGDFNAAFSNVPVLQDVQIVDPTTSGQPGFSPMIVKNCGVWQDVSILRSTGLLTQNAEGFKFSGVDNAGQIQVTNAWGMTSGLVDFEGGLLRSTSTNFAEGADIYDDVIIGNGSQGTFFQIGGRWGGGGVAGSDGVYIDTGGTWQPAGYGVLRCAGACETQVYGPGTMNVGGSVSVAVANATATVLQATWQMNGTATACAQSNVTPSVTNCGITLTPAHFDAAFGVAGFGSDAKSFFTGASIQNTVNN